ncbi:pirin family protein [Hirschia litorea]|uniref:Pirin family protein n=1 Tax=Hirschia litorea TaxID=1199156 RepID=A0ABW2IHZ2_9PROT
MAISTQNRIPKEAFTLRPSNERGMVDLGWLKSAHSFSFGQYFDPEHIQFESLRVINDDFIQSGKGFPQHPHKNAEIFSYVLKGQLEHKDSMGNGSVVKSGGIQYMSAGSGVTHSEFNPSQSEDVRLLQIWLLPNVENESPLYDTLDLTPEDKDGKLKLFLSRDGREGSMRIKSDADIYAATLQGNQNIEYNIFDGHKAWIQVARGSLRVNGQTLTAGDGLAINKGGGIVLSNGQDSEFILFDLESRH